MNWQTVPGYVFELCRKLRVEGTEPEKMLWQCLRGRGFAGLKFRRQHPIGRYIADFYCAEAKLVLELDGPHHEDLEEREYDAIRDEYLNARGLRILRF